MMKNQMPNKLKLQSTLRISGDICVGIRHSKEESCGKEHGK